jgi:hypothetical protein
MRPFYRLFENRIAAFKVVDWREELGFAAAASTSSAITPEAIAVETSGEFVIHWSGV